MWTSDYLKSLDKYKQSLCFRVSPWRRVSPPPGAFPLVLYGPWQSPSCTAGNQGPAVWTAELRLTHATARQTLPCRDKSLGEIGPHSGHLHQCCDCPCSHPTPGECAFKPPSAGQTLEWSMDSRCPGSLCSGMNGIKWKKIWLKQLIGSFWLIFCLNNSTYLMRVFLPL